MQGGAQRIWTSDGLQGRERSALGKAEEQKELALRRPCSSCCWAMCWEYLPQRIELTCFRGFVSPLDKAQRQVRKRCPPRP